MLCTAIAAVLQYLFLVAFALIMSLSIALYWKVSSLARGMRSDSISDVAYGLLVSWGEVIPFTYSTVFFSFSKAHRKSKFVWPQLGKDNLSSFLIRTQNLQRGTIISFVLLIDTYFCHNISFNIIQHIFCSYN